MSSKPDFDWKSLKKVQEKEINELNNSCDKQDIKAQRECIVITKQQETLKKIKEDYSAFQNQMCFDVSLF